MELQMTDLFISPQIALFTMLSHFLFPSPVVRIFLVRSPASGFLIEMAYFTLQSCVSL